MAADRSRRYHLMVGLGIVLHRARRCIAAILRWRGTLFEKRWLLWVFVFAVVGPYVANQARLGRGRGRPPAVDRLRACCKTERRRVASRSCAAGRSSARSSCSA